MKIYVASSWRNQYYTHVVEQLRSAGFEVYDFRNPPSNHPPFKWQNISEHWLDWTPEEYRLQLQHPLSEQQFTNDIQAMQSCDACLLLLPCGRSAHTEAGWFSGQGKTTVVLIPEKQEPELMYKLFNKVCCSLSEVLEYFQSLSKKKNK